jgi:electron transfer flavoprotein alpha subunit
MFSSKFCRAALVAGEADVAGTISKGSLQAISAAKKLSFGKCSVFVSNAETGNSVSKIEGVEKVYVLEKNPRSEELSKILCDLQKREQFTHIVAPNSSLWKDVLPRLAALLDVQPISDVLEISSDDTFKRPIYAGNALSTVKILDAVKIFTIRTTAFAAAPASATAAPLVIIPSVSVADLSVSTLIRQDSKPAGRADLATAARVVAGGRALKSKETFEAVLGPLCDKLGAALGASRAAVDAGYVSNELQVGQTGKVVAPELYIAVGISGAVQHLAGMKDSKVIVAINKDPEAPIFQVADFGLIADALTAVPELTAKI